MYRSTAALSAALLATMLGFGLSLPAAPAVAYDDDVDVVCFDYKGSNGSETECQTIDQLTAECEVADPEFTSDVCQGLLQNRKPLGLTSGKAKQRLDTSIHKGNGVLPTRK